MIYYNGKEFALFKRLENTLKIDYYFAMPYHSWERGSNENLIGLIRQFLSKGNRF
jgi:IS30 family transposase